MNVKCIALIFLLSSCAFDSNYMDGKRVERIEIYYKNFSTLTYMPYSEEHLLENHNVNMNIVDDNKISKVIGVMPGSCDLFIGSGKNADLHVLIRFYGVNNNLLVTYKFSMFSYSTSKDDSECKLSEGQRRSLERLIDGMKGE